MASTTTLLGAAGEHYVMSQFLRHGLISALAPIGVPNADLIVTDDKGNKLCAIQVKTRANSGADGGWHMSTKHEVIQSESLLYAFVDFTVPQDHAPVCYIVPSSEVAKAVRESHALWLSKPGKKGQIRNNSDLRRFLPNYDKIGEELGRPSGWLDRYKNAWHLAMAHE